MLDQSIPAPHHRKMRQWVRTTIAEPFPVFYSHASQTHRRAGDPAADGPFYAAGSQWFDLPERLTYRERCAALLREDGYTVTVDVVERAS